HEGSRYRLSPPVRWDGRGLATRAPARARSVMFICDGEFRADIASCRRTVAPCRLPAALGRADCFVLRCAHRTRRLRHDGDPDHSRRAVGARPAGRVRARSGRDRRLLRRRHRGPQRAAPRDDRLRPGARAAHPQYSGGRLARPVVDGPALCGGRAGRCGERVLRHCRPCFPAVADRARISAGRQCQARRHRLHRRDRRPGTRGHAVPAVFRAAGHAGDIADLLDAVLAEPLVRPTLWMTIVFTAFGAFFSPLYLVYGLKELGMSPALMGVNIAMGGVGALFGALLSNTLVRWLGVGRTVLTGGFLYAAFLLLVPLATGPLWLRTAMMMVAQFGGDAFALAFILPLTSLQQAILPRQVLGRTRGMFSVAAGGATVLGALIGGTLGAWLGVRETLAIAVVGIAAAPLFVLFSPLGSLR